VKASEIYRKAAQILERDEYRDTIPGACSAIADAAYPDKDRLDSYNAVDGKPILRDFEYLFCPHEVAFGYWGREWSDEGFNDLQALDCRIVALCFMAAIAEDE